MSKKRKEEDLIKALKRAARREFGMEPTRIASNKKKYARSREKWRYDENQFAEACVA